MLRKGGPQREAAVAADNAEDGAWTFAEACGKQWRARRAGSCAASENGTQGTAPSVCNVPAKRGVAAGREDQPAFGAGVQGCHAQAMASEAGDRSARLRAHDDDPAADSDKHLWAPRHEAERARLSAPAPAGGFVRRPFDDAKVHVAVSLKI